MKGNNDSILDDVLVIPPKKWKKENYVLRKATALRRFNITQEELDKAIRTGCVLKQHYFDEI